MHDQTFQKYKKAGAYHWDKISCVSGKYSPFLDARYKLALEMLGDLGNKKILDLGCGDGAFSGLISKKGGLVIGVDPNDFGLELAKKKFTEYNLKGDFYTSTLEFADNSFDRIACTEVIEHVNDPQNILEEIWRLLKPDGFAVITTPIRLAEYPTDKEHVREYFPLEFSSLFANQFEIIEIKHAIPVSLHEMILINGVAGKILGLFFRVLASQIGWNYLLSIKGDYLLYEIQLAKVRPLKR